MKVLRIISQLYFWPQFFCFLISWDVSKSFTVMRYQEPNHPFLDLVHWADFLELLPVKCLVAMKRKGTKPGKYLHAQQGIGSPCKTSHCFCIWGFLNMCSQLENQEHPRCPGSVGNGSLRLISTDPFHTIPQTNSFIAYYNGGAFSEWLFW